MCTEKDMGYVPKPGYLYETISKNPKFNDPLFQLDSDNSSFLTKFKNTTMVLPESYYGKRAMVSLLEYEPLMDSSNMTFDDWIKIATDIEHYYHDFDAFVVLHGTDTMAYTASALSFMLENLGKTVILTGSQIPLSEIRNDANTNLIGALAVATHHIIPEVSLYFSNALYRGNRVVKCKSSSFDAFESPNMKPLAVVGIEIDVDWSLVWRSHEPKPFRVRKVMNPNVTCLRLFPGITTDTIRAILSPTIRGVVLESFGAGNAPDNRQDVLDLFKDACSRGVVIVNISQCRVGNVSDLYATGKALTNAGVVPGLDMTTECALTKLACLLADDSLSPDQVRKEMMRCRVGELTKAKIDHLGSSVSSNFGALYSQLVDNLPTVVKHQFEPMLSAQFFHIAASKNEPEALQSILSTSSNFNIDVRDYMESTALLNAVSRGCIDSTKWLIDHGASVHVRNFTGQTALQIALSMRNIFKKGNQAAKYKQIIRMLLAAGARSDTNMDL